MTLPVAMDQNTESVNDHPLSSINVIGLLNNWEIFGQERGNIEVFRCLKALGAKVTVGVTTLHQGGEVATLLHQHGFETFDVPFGCQWSKKMFLRQPWLIFSNLRSVWRCSRILHAKINSTECNALLIGNPLVYSYVSLCLLLKKGLPLIYRMGDEPPFDSKPNLWIWKNCARRASVVVANSKYVSRKIAFACNATAEKVRLVYNVAPEHRGNDFDLIGKKTIEGSANAFRVLYVGQISEHKGIRHIVDLAVAMCRDLPDVYFDIVGASVYTTKIENELKNVIAELKLQSRIIFHGRTSNPDLFYEHASVLVVPSVFEEPAANVVLEAKRLGIPSVVYPSGGLPELVEHGRTGWVCEEKSSICLYNTILSIYKNRNSLIAIRTNCQNEYFLKYSSERFQDEWKAVILSSVAHE